jgi:hypothetical protein
MPLVAYAAFGLSARIMQFLLMVDDSFRDEENLEDRRPYMRATALLEHFFRLAPRVVFEAVRNFWATSAKQADIRDLPWPHQHALILSLVTILRKPPSSASAVEEEIREFLSSELPVADHQPLLLYVVPGILAPIPLIQDTSLYAVARCIKRYRLMISEEQTEAILSSMIHVMQSEPKAILISRVFLVLKSMILAGPAVNEDFIPRWFETIYPFPIAALAREDVQMTQLYRQVHYILELLIMNSPDKIAPRVASILEEVLQELSGASDAGLDEADMQVTLERLHLVQFCFYRFGTEFRAFGVRTAHLLFRLMQNHHSAIWEDALLTLILVITHLKSEVESGRAE